MNETSLIILFILCLIVGIGLLAIGVTSDNIVLMILGIVFLIISIVIAAVGDYTEKESIKNRCKELDGKIVEYKE